VHNSDNLCELWHLHHTAFPILREIVIGFPEFRVQQHGVCRGCTLGKHAKVAFQSNNHGSKEIPYLLIEDEEQEAPKVELGSPMIFQSSTTTFGWKRGDDSPLHFCQETLMVQPDIEGCSRAC
jgi:hypothetical protein